MLSPDEENILNVDHAAFDQAELKLLQDGLKRTYTERFLFMTRLYKIGQTLAKAKITHQPDVSPKKGADGHI